MQQSMGSLFKVCPFVQVNEIIVHGQFHDVPGFPCRFFSPLGMAPVVGLVWGYFNEGFLKYILLFAIKMQAWCSLS